MPSDKQFACVNTRPVIAIGATVSVQAGDASAEKKTQPKFTAEFYTGGALEINGWDLPVVVDLAGLENGKVLVANLDHDNTKRVGNFVVANDGRSLVANGTASARTAARDEVIGSAEDGYQWQASLEVSPKEVEAVKKGQEVDVNGQKFTGPLYVTRRGVLKGFAFVSHGADDNTSASIAAESADRKGTQMKLSEACKAWVSEQLPSLDLDKLSDQEIKNLEANFAGTNAPPEKKPTVTANDPFAKRKLEAKRVEEIRAHSDRLIEQRGKYISTEEIVAIEKMHDHAIETNMDPTQYRVELHEAMLPAGHTVRAMKRGNNEITNDVLKAAICQAASLSDLDKHFDDKTLQVARDKFRDGIGVKQLIAIAAKDRGYTGDGYNVTLDMQRAAFGQIHGSGFSTLHLPGILSDSAYKFLLEGWEGGEQTWADISDVTSVRDFKTITQYRLGGSLQYERVGATGQIKHGELSESPYTVKADTYGKMIAITREHIVNDDLSAFSQVARELGYGANDAFNEVFWTLFLSNPGSFFGAGNANVSSGTITAATVIASIAAAESVFFAQTKPNGTPLGVVPNVILAPNGAYRTLQAAMGSGLVVGSSGPTPNVNVFQGEYKVVRSAYLSNTSISGYSTAKWYLLVVRPGMAVTQTAFLNGQRSPAIESASADFNTLGIQMRGVHDFGVSMFEPRAGVQGSGA